MFYILCSLSPFPHKTLLWPGAVYPCMPSTHPRCLFSLCIPFSLSVFSACATSYSLQWCSRPCLLSCSGFFLNLHSHLSISLSPPFCYLSSQIISLPFYFHPFSSPALSLTASNMVYSLSCFPECEECCCFRMSPA